MSAQDWADRVKAALAGGASLATLIALVDRAPADASPGLLLSLLQQIAALLCDEDLDHLVDLDGLWQRGGQAVLNGWTSYAVGRLYEIERSQDISAALELRHRLTDLSEDLEKAGASGRLSLRMMKSNCALHVSADGLTVMAENLATHLQVLDAMRFGGADSPTPPNSFKRSI